MEPTHVGPFGARLWATKYGCWDAKQPLFLTVDPPLQLPFWIFILYQLDNIRNWKMLSIWYMQISYFKWYLKAVKKFKRYHKVLVNLYCLHIWLCCLLHGQHQHSTVVPTIHGEMTTHQHIPRIPDSMHNYIFLYVYIMIKFII